MAKLPTKKLTKTLVDSLVADSKDYFRWDPEPVGFGVKVLPSGTKVFVYQYQTPENQTRRFTLGKLSETLTVDQARKKARDAAFKVQAGRDPQGEKKERRQALTIDQLLDKYLLSTNFTGKAPSTQAIDRGRIDRHIRVLLGREIADKLTVDKVKRARTSITEGKTAARVKTGKSRGLAKVRGGAGTAKEAIILLKSVFNWALESGYVKTNPVTKIGKLARSGTRDTIMGGVRDYAELFKTLQKMEDERRIRSPAADAIRLITLTGMRRGEVTGLLWKWVDLKAGQITIPPKSHKAGHKTELPRIIALPAEAQIIIARQPTSEPDSYVFLPAQGKGLLSLQKPWEMARAEAELPPALGLHGLRHSIGSHLAMAGASIPEIMQVLGHREASSTQRYIHFAEAARSTLAERAASLATAGLRGQTELAPVTKIRKGE